LPVLPEGACRAREKDLSYEIAPVDLRKNEQKTANFSGLTHTARSRSSKTKRSSSTIDIINEYLEDEYPNPAPMPATCRPSPGADALEDYGDNVFAPDQPSSQPSSPALKESATGKAGRYRALVNPQPEWLIRHRGPRLSGHDFSMADAPRSRCPDPGQHGDRGEPGLKNLTGWLGRLRQLEHPRLGPLSPLDALVAKSRNPVDPGLASALIENYSQLRETKETAAQA
jgi:glutathione S-transferase